jgi:hypothetical protein
MMIMKTIDDTSPLRSCLKQGSGTASLTMRDVHGECDKNENT